MLSQQQKRKADIAFQNLEVSIEDIEGIRQKLAEYARVCQVIGLASLSDRFQTISDRLGSICLTLESATLSLRQIKVDKDRIFKDVKHYDR